MKLQGVFDSKNRGLRHSKGGRGNKDKGGKEPSSAVTEQVDGDASLLNHKQAGREWAMAERSRF